MKGWYNESYRHAFAARGIKTNYLYHGTSSDRYEEIRRRGLDPSVDVEGKDGRYSSPGWIYFTKDEDMAMRHAGRTVCVIKLGHQKRFSDVGGNEPILLRVKQEDLEKLIGENTHEHIRHVFRYYENYNNFPVDRLIPSNLIEIEGEDGRWRKLK